MNSYKLLPNTSTFLTRRKLCVSYRLNNCSRYYISNRQINSEQYIWWIRMLI